MALTRQDFIYMAGLFDGEGTVAVRLFRRPDRHTPQLTMGLAIANSDPTVLYWLEENVGGKVTFYERSAARNQKQDFYVWQISGSDAAWFARKIVPWSRMKGFQLSKFIELRERIGSKEFVLEHGGRSLSAEEWAVRGSLVNEILADRYRRKVG